MIKVIKSASIENNSEFKANQLTYILTKERGIRGKKSHNKNQTIVKTIILIHIASSLPGVKNIYINSLVQDSI